jgi:membrane fusion protein, copper/silver efflux system
MPAALMKSGLSSATISDQLVNAVKSFGIEEVVYHQYCPMAFDDEGGYWLSSEEQIQNPYLPETMLMCGEVIERIEQP